MGITLKGRTALLLVLLAPVLFAIPSCSDDDNSPSKPAAAADDYFPFGRNHRWTYTSNILAQEGIPVLLIETKIDTATSWSGSVNKGLFWRLMARDKNAHGEWGTVIGLKDSLNNIYSLGDNPPEPAYKLWQHTYTASEGVRDTITVQGTTYNTIRIEVESNGVKVRWWFAPNIGLIKEYSEKGGSIFTDDQWGDDVIMNTELVSYEKIP